MTDFTELAQRLATCAKEGSYPVLSPVECGALVETLEKAQRANAAQDDHINQQQDRINRMEKRNSELGKRLRGTEESLIAATDMVRELESRTVTVKLPADRLAESEVSDYDGTEFYRAGWNARGKADKEALTAQGIKWEAE